MPVSLPPHLIIEAYRTTCFHRPGLRTSTGEKELAIAGNQVSLGGKRIRSTGSKLGYLISRIRNRKLAGLKSFEWPHSDGEKHLVPDQNRPTSHRPQ